jgi:hypothetical protein
MLYHLIILDFSTLITGPFGEKYVLLNSLLLSFLLPPATSTLFGPNVIFSIYNLTHCNITYYQDQWAKYSESFIVLHNLVKMKKISRICKLSGRVGLKRLAVASGIISVESSGSNA